MNSLQEKREEIRQDDQPSKVRVLIADDHALVVEAVGRVLEASGGFEYYTVSSMGEAVKALIDGPAFDIALVDVKMPGVNGLDSFKRVIERAPNTMLLLFSGEVDPRFVKEAMKLGVRGLIPKSMRLKSMVSAIHLVLSGETYLPSELKLATGERIASQSDSELSEIEMKILLLAAQGYMNKEIGEQLILTEVAVKMHMRSVCKKLNAKNRTHAAMMARDLGFA